MFNDNSKNTPRDVFLYALAVGTLYFAVGNFINLYFEYINALFPDVLNLYYASFNESIRFSMSVLLIVFPVYLGVTWFLKKDSIRYPEKREMKTRKWLLYLTLFLAAIMMIVDLVILVNFFLKGELTVRFGLKVVVVLVTAIAVFGYYLWDLRREIKPGDKPSKIIAIIAGVVVLASIVGGFFIVGSPATQRKRGLDDQRISGLQMIQSEVVNYWSQKKYLPKKLTDLNSDITGFVLPVDPETKAAYEYKVNSALSFDLCATFSVEYSSKDASSVARPMAYPGDVYANNWDHAAGRVCYTRKIDPQLQKPFLKPY
jgi:hypothetical protein